MGLGCALLWLIACGDDGGDSAEDTGFRVTSTDPVDGADDVTAGTVPELRVNADASEETCTPDSLKFEALNLDDSTVAFELPYEIEIQNGSKIRFQPWPDREKGLFQGYRYSISVATDVETRCTDTDGHELEPFGLIFEVK